MSARPASIASKVDMGARSNGSTYVRRNRVTNPHVPSARAMSSAKVRT